MFFFHDKAGYVRIKRSLPAKDNEKKATDSLVGSQSFLMLTVVGILKLPFT